MRIGERRVDDIDRKLYAEMRALSEGYATQALRKAALKRIATKHKQLEAAYLALAETL